MREGWQRKSSVERSGTEIVANSLTRTFRGARPNKKSASISESTFNCCSCVVAYIIELILQFLIANLVKIKRNRFKVCFSTVDLGTWVMHQIICPRGQSMGTGIEIDMFFGEY